MVIKNNKWRNLLLLSAVLTVLIVLFEIIPRYSELFTTISGLIQRGNEIESLGENKIKINELTFQNRTLKAEINNIVSDYEENKNISVILGYLYQAASANGIDLSAVKPGKLIHKENLWLQPVEISVSSRYENIFNFLRHLEKSSKVIIVKEVSLIPEELLQSKLSLTATVDIYLNL